MPEADLQRIRKCRAGGGTDLVTVLDLGRQALTGVFPRSSAEPVSSGRLELLWAPRSGLVQLGHSFAPSQMYGADYGYRSGLNGSMVRHLTSKMQMLEKRFDLRAGDAVLDIGSNDATSLKAYTVSDRDRSHRSQVSRLLSGRSCSRRRLFLGGCLSQHGRASAADHYFDRHVL